VVSPWAKEGYVSHEVTDHSSILRLIQARFGLAALTQRDANASPLLDMLEFPATSIDAGVPDAPVDCGE